MCSPNPTNPKPPAILLPHIPKICSFVHGSFSNTRHALLFATSEYCEYRRASKQVWRRHGQLFVIHQSVKSTHVNSLTQFVKYLSDFQIFQCIAKRTRTAQANFNPPIKGCRKNSRRDCGSEDLHAIFVSGVYESFKKTPWLAYQICWYRSYVWKIGYGSRKWQLHGKN